MKILIVVTIMAGLMLSVFAADPTGPRISPADAKSHIGENAMICGKVVDTDIRKNAIQGYGFPISFYVDQPQTAAVFSFIAFGSQPSGPQEDAQKLLKLAEATVADYKGKTFCVTGKVAVAPSGGAPFIFASHRSQLKLQEDTK